MLYLHRDISHEIQTEKSVLHSTYVKLVSSTNKLQKSEKDREIQRQR